MYVNNFDNTKYLVVCSNDLVNVKSVKPDVIFWFVVIHFFFCFIFPLFFFIQKIIRCKLLLLDILKLSITLLIFINQVINLMFQVYYKLIHNLYYLFF